jgi:predicted HNH restriction endonuclease
MGKEITEKDMWEEVEKCILLCPNCHAKEHTEYSYYKLMENTNLLGV